MAKKNKIGIPEIDELLTPAERAIALTLYGIYWSQLAATDMLIPNSLSVSITKAYMRLVLHKQIIQLYSS